MKFPLLPRKKNTDKSRYGHALIVAGSDSMPGAAMLAARAALASGSGLVTLASTRRVTALAVSKMPDLLTLPLSSSDGTLRVSAAGTVLRYAAARRVNAVAIGPGLSVTGGAQSLARCLVRSLNIPIVLDADGLNAFKSKAALLKHRRAAAILTPHAREFQRIFGAVPKSEAARARLAKAVARDYSIVLVLKGHRTVVTDGRRLYLNPTGNPGMAKGGTGDVLTGMIAAFLAQRMAPFEAASWAVHLHGKAGDRLARKTSELSVTASGLLEELPTVFKGTSRHNLSLG